MLFRSPDKKTPAIRLSIVMDDNSSLAYTYWFSNSKVARERANELLRMANALDALNASDSDGVPTYRSVDGVPTAKDPSKE